LLVFIIGGLLKERATLNVELLPMIFIVILHNAFGLFTGYITSIAMNMSEKNKRAIMIEGGMQNSGLALGIIALQFNANFAMVIIASLWGIWHIISGLALALYWRKQNV
jgi:BASS family bile acid:Na+ symporter